MSVQDMVLGRQSPSTQVSHGPDAYGSRFWGLLAGTGELVDARAGLTCPVLGAKATQEPLHGLDEPPLSSKDCDQRV